MLSIVSQGGAEWKGKGIKQGFWQQPPPTCEATEDQAISAQPEWECVWRSGEPRKRGQDKEIEKEETGTYSHFSPDLCELL